MDMIHTNYESPILKNLGSNWPDQEYTMFDWMGILKEDQSIIKININQN